MRSTLGFLVSALLAVPLAASATSFDSPRTFHVDCDSGRQTIGRALTRARDGDTIRVDGECKETLTIDKAVTLDGGGSASISPARSTDRTLTVFARGVTIRGFRLEAPAMFQIAAFGGASVTVQENTIRHATNFGVSSALNSVVIVQGNTIADNGLGGAIALSGGALSIGSRFFSEPPMPNRIIDNQQFGVAVISNGTARILGGNTISGNNIGVGVTDGGQARVAGNHIDSNNIGILVDGGAALQLPLASNPNPLLTSLNRGVNLQLGIACKGGTIQGVPDGLAPAVRLPPTPGVLGGPSSGLPTHCLDQTVSGTAGVDP